MTITELAIKRPSLVVVVFVFLGVLGIFGFTQLKYDLMPKMNIPTVTIQTVYPGAAPSEIENTVTKTIEDAVTGIDKVSDLLSTSSENRSFVVMQFDMDANIDLAIQDVQRKVNQIQDLLPKDAKKPVVSKISFDELPVLRMAVKSDMKTKDFYQFVKDKVQPRLSKIEGVGLVALIGGEEREIKVLLDADKVQAYGLSLPQVAASVNAANIDFPTGTVKQNNSQYIVRVAGKFTTVDELANLIIGRSIDGDIRLKDVADVRDDIKEITNYYRLNGEPAIGIVVQKQSDANTVDVSKKVREELAQMEKDYAQMHFSVNIAQDGSTFIMDSANAVKEDLLLAILLVAFVMFIFLHSFRNSFIVLVSIPTSLISTFFVMYIFGFTLNIMTLLAMSLVIGILVDDSIVVIENIHRHLEMGQKPADAALAGRNEIGFAALSITLVDVVVFVPLALIVGIIGNFLREYSLVVVFSTLMSLFVSFTVTPVLASRFSKLEEKLEGTLMGKFGIWIEKRLDWISEFYQATLRWALKNGGKVIIGIILIFISSFALVGGGFIGFEFMPGVDRSEVIATLELDPGVNIERTNEISREVEKILKGFPEVQKILTNAGASSEGMIGFSSNNTAEVFITLTDKKFRKETTDEIGLRIKNEIAKIPGVRPRVAAVSMMGTANRTPIQILVNATTYEEASAAAKKIQEIVKSVKGTIDVRLSSEDGKTELRVDVDRQKLAALGLSISDVGSALRIALTGDENSKYRDGANEYIIRVQLDQLDRSNPDEIKQLTFKNNKGQQITLSQFANVYQTTGPTKLERQKRMTSVNIYSQVFGKTSGALAQEIDKKIKAEANLPAGVNYEFIGEQKFMKDAFLSLIYAIFAAILFVFMIMVALYDSYIYPFVVLFSIPVSFVGALYGLALTNKSLSIYSMLGMIMLMGLVAKNAILLVDRANQMKLERGLSTYEALLESAGTRLRPILMTTFSMVIGMMPIALSTSAGSEAKTGLAVALIGGLLSSLMLTLVLVPVVYQWVDKMKAKTQRKPSKAVSL